MHVDVTADCMAALLVLDTELERLPEPFRMQIGVEMRISLDEYVRFVQSLPEGSHLLHSQTDNIVEAICNGDDTKLLRAFYTDVALGVCKELCFAEAAKHPATAIRHHISGSIKATVPPSTEAYDILRYLVAAKGYRLPAVVSEVNRQHWEYAGKLITVVLSQPTHWVEV